MGTQARVHSDYRGLCCITCRRRWKCHEGGVRPPTGAGVQSYRGLYWRKGGGGGGGGGGETT